jgi:hypothetical protein
MDFEEKYKDQLNEIGQFKNYDDYLQYIYITFKDEIDRKARELAKKRGVEAVISCLKGFKLLDGKQVKKINTLHPKDYLEFLYRLECKF